MHGPRGQTLDIPGRQTSPQLGLYRKPRPTSISMDPRFIGVLIHGLSILKSIDFGISSGMMRLRTAGGLYEARRDLSPCLHLETGTSNQRLELEVVAERSGWQVVRVFEDAGI